MSSSLVHRLLGRSLSVLLVLSLLCNSTPAATLDNCWRSTRVASGPRVLTVREWLAGKLYSAFLGQGPACSGPQKNSTTPAVPPPRFCTH